MHHPFYDPSGLTDNEIHEKLYELMEKQTYAQNQGLQTLSDNIGMVIYELRMQQEKRLYAEEKIYNDKHGINPDEPLTLGEIEELDTTPKEE